MKSPQPLMRVSESTWIDPSTISSIAIRPVTPANHARVVTLTMRSGKPVEIEFGGESPQEHAEIFVDRLVRTRDGDES